MRQPTLPIDKGHPVISIRLTTLAVLFFSAAAVHAQPSLAWQHAAGAPTGDGARAYLYGRESSGGPFPIDLPVEEPAYQSHAVVPLADGAYVIVPINGGGATGNLGRLLNPSWLVNRGWQILRMDAAGQLLWQRTTRRPHGAAYLSIPIYGQALTIGDAKRTASGGLALIVDGGLLVLDAQGSPLLQLDLNAARCGLGAAFSFPDRAFLSDDDVLVLGYDSLQTGASRACAVDYSGQEIETIVTDGATAMGVVDYRRSVGFLVSNGVFNNGSWGNASTSLRSATTTRWTVPGPFLPQPDQVLAPNGDAWVSIGDHVRIYDPAGATRGDIADFLCPRSWLAGGDALIADESGADVRRVHGDGSAVWQRTLPEAPGAPVWQLLPDRARMLQADLSKRSLRTASLALTDGAVLDDHARAYDFRQAAGLVGSDRLVTVDRGLALSRWERDVELSCEEDGYCPDAVEYAQPVVAVREQTTGALVTAVPPAQLVFPLTTRLRELQPKVLPIPGGSGDVIHVQYRNDGYHEMADVMRIGRNGLRAWRTTLSFARFDAALAAAVVTSDAVYVSGAAHGPNASQHRLWKLDLNGSVQWQTDLPYAIAQLVAVHPIGDTARVCGVSASVFTRWLCVSAPGAIVRDVALPVSGTERLRILGTENGNTVVQRVPESSPLTDEIALGRIDPAGNYIALPRLVFDPPSPPQRLRVDVVQLGPTILATALVHATDSGFGRPVALLIARFERNGNRLWQRRIETPLRAIDDSIVNSLVAVNGDDDVFVGFHPYADNVAFPTRVCRFESDGTPAPCADAPMQGRVNAFLPSTEDSSVLVWASVVGLGTSPNHPDGMALYRFANNAFSAPLITVPGYRTGQVSTMASDGRLAWFVIESSIPFGPRIDPTNAPTAVIAVSLIDLFSDGFE